MACPSRSLPIIVTEHAVLVALPLWLSVSLSDTLVSSHLPHLDGSFRPRPLSMDRILANKSHLQPFLSTIRPTTLSLNPLASPKWPKARSATSFLLAGENEQKLARLLLRVAMATAPLRSLLLPLVVHRPLDRHWCRSSAVCLPAKEAEPGMLGGGLGRPRSHGHAALLLFVSLPPRTYNSPAFAFIRRNSPGSSPARFSVCLRRAARHQCSGPPQLVQLLQSLSPTFGTSPGLSSSAAAVGVSPTESTSRSSTPSVLLLKVAPIRHFSSPVFLCYSSLSQTWPLSRRSRAKEQPRTSSWS